MLLVAFVKQKTHVCFFIDQSVRFENIVCFKYVAKALRTQLLKQNEELSLLQFWIFNRFHCYVMKMELYHRSLWLRAKTSSLVLF